MNKPLLTIGILLSLGTVGCAGFGVQHGSSLTARVQDEQGVDNLWVTHVDNLWVTHEEAPTQGLEAPAYAEQGLGGLWDAREAPSTSAGATRSFADRGFGSLSSSSF
jgi:hypothetical protein